MSLETGSYINDLVASNPPGTDPKSSGDDHIRLIKTSLKNCFAGFTGAILVTGTDGGVINAYTLTPANAIVAYVNRMIAIFSPVTANSGAATINISGLGVKSLTAVDGTALVANDLTPGLAYAAVYNGTEFRLLYATKNYIDQKAFATALPAQVLGFLRSDGTASAFTKKHTGYAQDEVKGADVPSAATVNLQTATGNFVHITGTTSITAVTLDSGAEREVVFDGVLTLTNGASLILPSGANITTAAGDCATFRGEPSGVVRVVKYQKASGLAVAQQLVGDHEVVVVTGSGNGSINTAIRRFATTLSSVGTAITYTDSATLGASFTINETGLYSMGYTESSGVDLFFGISKNSAQLTTAINTITAADRLIMGHLELDVNYIREISRVTRLQAGDVVRPHGDPAISPANTYSFFAIRKIGV